MVPASKAAPAAPARGGGGWLPKAFVKDFNLEGDEVEPDPDGAHPDEGLAELHADEGLAELQLGSLFYSNLYQFIAFIAIYKNV